MEGIICKHCHREAQINEGMTIRHLRSTHFYCEGCGKRTIRYDIINYLDNCKVIK